MKWIDSIPLVPLVVFALLLGLAPFYPEPHLVQKITMLFQGVLSKPIDIFDLLMHGTPVALLIIRVLRINRK